MAQQYKWVLTLAGQALVAQSISGGPAVTITQLAVGDGDGTTPTPIETQVALVREFWRGAVLSASRDPDHPTHVLVRALIPAAAGPNVMREAALIASTGELFAVGSTAEKEISTSAQGEETTIDLTAVLVVDTAAVVTVTVDPETLIGVAGLLRVPFIAIDGFVAAPPANPALGALVVVSAGAGGAFAGLDHKFAQWNGSLWLSAPAAFGTRVALPDGSYWRRAAAAWERDDEAVYIATAAVIGGNSNAIALSRAGSYKAPVALADGMLFSFRAPSDNTGAMAIDLYGLGGGTKVLADWGGGALTGGELRSGRPAMAMWSAALGKALLLPWCSAKAGAHHVVTWQAAGTYTWTVPAGVTEIYGTVVGSGGGAAPGGPAYGRSGGGGGSGGTARGWIKVTPGEVITIIVAPKGLGAAYSAGGANATANPGATSSLGSYMSATGGTPGSNSAAAVSVGGGGPGHGIGGQENLFGGYGGDGNSQTHLYPGGNGGASSLGGGGRTSTTSPGASDGVAPGSGGGGGWGTPGAAGGNGADGSVTIQY